MKKPFVSVVMVICNVERYLAESIESILGQTFQDFEFIIVDFGSTDQSKAVAASYAAKDKRVKFHEIPPCALPVARNAGCFLAQGRYIAVMDADDISLQNRLALQVDYLEKHPEVALLGGATEWVDATGKSLEIQHKPNTNAEIKAALVTHCPFWHPTVVMRTKAFVSVGGYRAAFVCAHDYDIELRIAEQFECANLSQVMLKYRVHPYQVSMRKRRQQTLCLLAAQASASSRRIGNPDPLDAVTEISPAFLVKLGVTEAMQQSDLASDFRDWVRIMIAAAEYSGALKATVEFLQTSDWKLAETWQIADLWLTAAQLYWAQEEFLSSILATARAVMVRPVVLGRPVKSLLRRIGLARNSGGLHGNNGKTNIELMTGDDKNHDHSVCI
jgi:Glycosyl transferase family 2